ncbi:MAG: penicillin-insensitive murein endopeptidase [Clostridia bacterium]|nr:penicillin-insensitive murein endopeptidase [Deltaproteobacteria bacterium]
MTLLILPKIVVAALLAAPLLNPTLGHAEPLAPFAPSQVQPVLPMAGPSAPAPGLVIEPQSNDQLDDESAEEESAEADDEDVDSEGDAGEGESRDEASGIDPGVVYSTDITDAQLADLFVNAPAKLGSISIGFADEGRMLNAVQMPKGSGWVVVQPDHAWGTQETIDGLIAAAGAVYQRFPNALPLRVNHISQREGGYVRPHHSHQSGRDADLGFYYNDEGVPNIRDRRPVMDAALNWALLRQLITQSDVQVILVDRKISSYLHDYALSIGEDEGWLQSVFVGPKPLVQHARRHRDHFHVRFFSPRSQELGRRVQPLLAKRPETNLVFHRVRHGDTLGFIARKYGTSVPAIMKASRMRSSMLSIGRSLMIPLRGPCTRCPMPPALLVPEKRLPPAQNASVVVPNEALGS